MRNKEWMFLIRWSQEWADDDEEELELLEAIIKVKNKIRMTRGEMFHLWDCVGCMERNPASQKLYEKLEVWNEMA